MKVHIYSAADGEDERVGTYEWNGSEMLMEPTDSRVLNNLLDYRMTVEGSDEFLTSESDPEEWLKRLHQFISTPQLRASKPIPDNATVHPALAAAIIDRLADGDQAGADRLAKLAEDPHAVGAIIDDDGSDDA